MAPKIICEPQAAALFDAPQLGKIGLLMLPPDANALLSPAIELQNRAPHQVRVEVVLIAVEAQDYEGHRLPGGMYLRLHFVDTLEGDLLVPLMAPFERWVGPLTADAEVLLTTDPEITEAFDVPAYKTVRLNRRMQGLVDTNTFPLKMALRQFMPRWLRKLAANPPEYTVSHEIVSAFGDYLQRQSAN